MFETRLGNRLPEEVPAGNSLVFIVFVTVIHQLENKCKLI